MDKGKVFVTGDVAIDWFEMVQKPQAGVKDTQKQNWKRYNRIIRTPLVGGSLLLSECVKRATNSDVNGPKLLIKPEAISSDQMILSEALLDYDKNAKAYFVSQGKGYSGPAADKKPECLTPKNKILQYAVNADKAKLVIVDDPGNGFRDSRELFPKKITRNAIVLHKMHAPLAQGPFWQWLKHESKIDPEKVVTIIDGNDLRKIKETDITRSLSWEKTARNFAFHILLNCNLADLSECANLVILFDTDGAIVYRGTENGKSVLIFDPMRLEGGFAREVQHDVMGKVTVFTSFLASHLLKDGIAGLEDGVKEGLAGMRRFMCYGYTLTDNTVNIDFQNIFLKNHDASNFNEVTVPKPTRLDDPDPEYWTILDYKTSNTRDEIAKNIIVNGEDDTLKGVPEVKFGKVLTTIDRSEIESYSGIQKLISEYLDNPSPKNPLCIAVFGSPGSGKSFGVKQIAQKIGGGRIDISTFNLSQFADYEDLVGAFHRTRDVSLSGKIPLVFFDEFDSDNLKWLKYFLAPMQDGEFLDGEAVYHTGNAIFVFAGGTCSSFGEFAENMKDKKSEKLPDFISRLRGFVDIKGPNPQNVKLGDTVRQDNAFILRRAKILRSMFERSPKAKGLFDSDGKTLNIDDSVLRALLNIPRYRHGNRSMEAIIEMSRLVGQKIFDSACLPPRKQLDLHVNSDIFFFLAAKERFYLTTDEDSFIETETSLIEKLAEKIHASYIKNCKQKSIKINVPEEYKDLTIEYKEANKHAAEDIPEKMRSIKMGIRRVPENGFPRTPLITEDQIEMLAEMEHKRFCREQRLHGWVQGKKRINVAKIRNDLIPFKDLDRETQDKDRDAVLYIPMILSEENFEIFPKIEKEELSSDVIESLARVIHEDYCKRNPDPSNKSYDELDEDDKNSNRDNAFHIPSKLYAIGYGIRHVKKGKNAIKLEFSKDEIDKMARMEHDRWVWFYRIRGWTLDRKLKKKNKEHKTHPSLKPFDRLKKTEQDKDRDTVRLIPEILARVGYEAYRLKKKK